MRRQVARVVEEEIGARALRVGIVAAAEIEDAELLVGLHRVRIVDVDRAAPSRVLKNSTLLDGRAAAMRYSGAHGPASRGTRGRAMRSLLILFLGVGCGSPSLPDLSAADLSAARARWLAQGIADYELDLRVHGTGLDPAVIHLEVRGDSVLRAERAGVPMTGDTIAYTVPGLFTTLERELELKANPAQAGAPPGYQVYVQADFDPELGYPPPLPPHDRRLQHPGGGRDAPLRQAMRRLAKDRHARCR